MVYSGTHVFMNFLFVGTLYEKQIDGGMTHLVTLTKAMADAGHRVAMLARSGSNVAEAMTAASIPVYPGAFRNAFDVRGYTSLQRAAKTFRPDVLVSGSGKELMLRTQPDNLCG